MDIDRIIYILEQNGIEEVEEVIKSDNIVIVKFIYEFDREESSAARAYSNQESEEEEGCSEWYSEWYMPYLYDIAKDNIQEVIEEICEEFDVEGEFKEIEDQKGETDYMRGMAILCKDSSELDLEDILSKYLN